MLAAPCSIKAFSRDKKFAATKIFGRTPGSGMVTTGSVGVFRLRRRMRSGSAQDDSAMTARGAAHLLFRCTDYFFIIIFLKI